MSPVGKGPLRIAIEDFIDTFGFGKRVKAWWIDSVEFLEDESYLVYDNIVKQLGISQYLPGYLQPASIKANSHKAPVQLGAIVLMLAGVILGVFAGAMQPISRIVMYQVDKVAMSYRPDPTILLQAWRRNKAYQSTIDDVLKELGVGPSIKAFLDVATQQLLSPVELIQAFRRGLYAGPDYFAKMEQLGFGNGPAGDLLKITEPIPGAGDLISMAVREAWNEETVSLFKYDEGFPPEFGEWMTKLGFDKQWAIRYWRQHWNLPGPQQVFEMFQRLRPGQTSTPFTESDLAVYLKTADYPEFWRKRLTEIAYSPLTRVDVRRMYGTGTLNADQVYQAYRDLGYNDKNAKLLTEFTTHVEKAEEKGLTRGAIQDAYRIGYWTKEQAITALHEVGYNDEDANFWLGLVDIELSNRQLNDKLDVIKAKYVSDILNDQTVYNELGPLNLPAERVTLLLQSWNVLKYNRVNLPSRSELDEFLRRGIITEEDYQKRLKRDGYESDVISMFVQRIDAIISDDTRIKQAEAQAEQERIAKAAKATTYQKAVADLNVQMADIDVNIADIKVALHDVTNPDDIATLKKTISLLQEQKKVLVLQKAQLKFDLVNG